MPGSHWLRAGVGCGQLFARRGAGGGSDNHLDEPLSHVLNEAFLRVPVSHHLANPSFTCPEGFIFFARRARRFFFFARRRPSSRQDLAFSARRIEPTHACFARIQAEGEACSPGLVAPGGPPPGHGRLVPGLSPLAGATRGSGCTTRRKVKFIRWFATLFLFGTEC